MTNNLYGPRYNFDLAGAHLLPALLRKFHEARLGGQAEVTIWGTGAPKREFMNVDDLAILRPVFDEDTRHEDVREALLMAFRQVGKKYDFNFDVNTTDKIVCSELAYISFPVFDWPTEAVLGRHSISPDNVAQMAWNNVPLRLVMFYHDGELVPEDDQVEKMRELMLD